MKLSDYVIDFIAKQGVKHVFLLPGGGAMHLNNSLGGRDDIEYVCNLHEQASAMAAETYAKATGGLGVALLTTGPGGTNAVTGVAGAWLDSTPCLFVSGQAKRTDLKRDTGVRQMGVQEVDIVSIVGSITKYAVTVLDPENIRFHLERAVHLATTGRPGPVWIDIPLDLQAATIDPDSLVGFISDDEVDGLVDATLDQQVAQVVEMLCKAERPVILAGHGIRLAGAGDDFLDLLERVRVPALTTWLAADLLPYHHAWNFGRPGTVAQRGANFVLQNCDLLISIGSRIDFTITGYAPDRLARGARKVMVDVDSAELDKLRPYLSAAIQADAGKFMRTLLDQSRGADTPDRSAWIQRCREWKATYPVVLPEHRRPEDRVSTYHLAEILSEELREGEVIVSGSSGAGIEIFQLAFRLKAGQRLFQTTALGAMGNGLPSAIGACLASGRETICVDGDGGIQLNVQEFATVHRLQLPIKFFILSNEGFSSIRTSQQRWFGRLTAADADSGLVLPDVLKVAAAYGLPTARIEDQSDLRAQLRAVLDTAGPVVCEVVCVPDEARKPSLASVQRQDGSMVSKPLEDLWPFLEREELRANMIVPVLED